MTQQFTHKVDSLGHHVGGDYYDSLKNKAQGFSDKASDLLDGVISHPSVEKLHKRAMDLKAEADRQYAAASSSAGEYAERARVAADEYKKAAADYAAHAKQAGMDAGAKVQGGVDSIKSSASDSINRASLHGAGIGENVKHTINEAVESVRHTSAETQEALRHRAATMQNAASQKVQDVKDAVHNIKDAIKGKL